MLFCFSCPKSQCTECFKQLFKSFSDWNWIAKVDRDRVKDWYLEFLDDLRHVYIDEFDNGPEIDDTIVLLSRCPKLERRIHTRMLFIMCWSWLSQNLVRVPYVGLASSKSSNHSVDLSAVIVLLQGYHISLGRDCSFVTDSGSFGDDCSKIW